jgi:hypothetical protein
MHLLHSAPLDWECIETWNANLCQDTLSRVTNRGAIEENVESASKFENKTESV